MIRNPRFHCGRHAQAPVTTPEVVPGVPEDYRSPVVLPLLTESVGESREPAKTHPCAEISLVHLLGPLAHRAVRVRPRAHHQPKMFISPLLASLYENPPAVFHTPADYAGIERAGALACRTPCYRSSPGSPAATLGDGQRHVFGSDLAEWPAIGLSNTVCMGAS